MANAFVWNELNSTDPEKSQAFFGKLFDWEFEKMSAGDNEYTFIKVDGEAKGAIMKQMMPGAPSMFVTYVGVDDLDAKTAQVSALGGKVMVANVAAGEFGHLSVVADPTGAIFALWKPNPNMPG